MKQRRNEVRTPGAQFVPIAPGLVVKSPITAEFTGVPPDDYDVTLTIEARRGEDGGRAGRFVCTELTIRGSDGAPVTNARMRGIPIAFMTNYAGAQHVKTVEGETDDGAMVVVDRVMPEGVAANGPTDEALRWVAHAYRLALVVGERPTKSVREAMELPPSTAARWVQLARKRGFLGAAEGPGKAGG